MKACSAKDVFPKMKREDVESEAGDIFSPVCGNRLFYYFVERSFTDDLAHTQAFDA